MRVGAGPRAYLRLAVHPLLPCETGRVLLLDALLPSGDRAALAEALYLPAAGRDEVEVEGEHESKHKTSASGRVEVVTMRFAQSPRVDELASCPVSDGLPLLPLSCFLLVFPCRLHTMVGRWKEKRLERSLRVGRVG